MKRQAFALPLILVFVVLIACSVVIITTFGSGTRNIVRLAENESRCEMAARSALHEARQNMSAILRTPCEQWPPFYKTLLPPCTGAAPADLSFTPEVSSVAYLPHVEVGEVTVKCLDRRISNGLCQGLISLRVKVIQSSTIRSAIGISMEEWIRFVVERHPKRGLTVLLLPGRVCSEVKRQ